MKGIEDFSHLGTSIKKQFSSDPGSALTISLKEVAEKLVEMLHDSIEEKLRHNSSGFLGQSIHALPEDNSNGVRTIKIEWEEYGDFLDEGVKGKGGIRKSNGINGEKKGDAWEQNAPNSKFSYKSKMPPTNFSTRGGESLAQVAARLNVSPFAIASSIFHKGIKANHWISDVLDSNELDKLLDQLAEVIGEKINIVR